MELTPQAVSDAEFREAKRGGYNIRDVDDFLDQVAIGIGQLHERVREAYHRAEAAEANLAEAHRQLDGARQAASAPAPGAAAAAPPGGENDETFRRTLMLAQRTADATIAEAKEEASRLLEEARGESARVRADAEAAALGDVAVARDEVERQVEQLQAQRAELEGDIAKLEDHIQAQRANLQAGLKDLQELLEDRASLQLDPKPRLSQAVDEIAPQDPEDDQDERRRRSLPEPPPEPMFPVPGPEEPSRAGNGLVPGTRLSSEQISPFRPGTEGPPPANASPFAPPALPPLNPPPSPSPSFSASLGPAASPAPAANSAPAASPVAPADNFGTEPERPPLPARGGQREPQGPGRPGSESPAPGRGPEPFPAFEPPPEGNPYAFATPERDVEPEPSSSTGPDPLPAREPLPRRDSPNVADLQELSGPALSGSLDGSGRRDDGVQAIFPPSLGPPPGATGFLPDLPQPPGSNVPAEGTNGDLPMSVDAPPPPPPPAEPLLGSGGLPLDSGDRPSAWGRAFDEPESDDQDTGIRFGRK